MRIDLHIHSALSPCGDNDMTPNNIVNMSRIKGLDIIAITDHNSCENVPACMDAAKQAGIIVIPGMELQTREDIHVLCLFKSLVQADEFQDIVYKNLPKAKNRPEIFGEQLVMDSEDNIVGINDRMLLGASDISFDEAYSYIRSLNGVFIPAHVDRDSYSVISNLGFIPDYLKIKTLEYHSEAVLNKYIQRKMISDRYKFIKSSDAHYLDDILEGEDAIDFDHVSTAEELLEYLG